MNCSNNLLVSGYIRDDEHNIKLQIPNVIINSIGLYCREYAIQILGVKHSIKCSDFQMLLSNTTNLNIDREIDTYDDEIIDIKSSSKHKLYLTSKGNTYGMGSNESGQLGLGINIKHVNTPTLIPFNNKIKSIACGELHSLFLGVNGKLLVCGFNYCNQLGMELDREEILSSDDTDSSMQSLHSSDSDDSVSSNNSFELFAHNLTQRNCVFKPIYNKYFANLNITFKSINCGLHHSLCIATNGECFTFGYNGYGNLGNGQINEWGEGDRIPYNLDMDKSFRTAFCGEHHNVLLTTNNEIVVFGDNSNNQCSVEKKKVFKKPYVLSKEKEFGIPENSVIEHISHIDNKIMLVIDLYQRQLTSTYT